MRFLAALLFTLALTSGCTFDKSALQSSVQPDSGVSDSLPDNSRGDTLDDSGADVGKTDSGQDTQQFDSIQKDANQSDVLQQDVIDPCAGITCSGHGTCSAGVCSCNAGYTGDSCESCAFAYLGYPNCATVAPTITNLTVGCDQDCIGGTTYDVTWNFTDATNFSVNLTWLSGTMTTLGTIETVSGSPITLNTSYPLPATTTGTTTSHSIHWIMGGPGEKNIRITVTVTGPGGTAPANKSVHVIN